ncbi:hypothetical protein K5M36_02895 [Chromobacterium vaccinii]|nr:hypothetical protein [Chromobacterium vaccinii]
MAILQKFSEAVNRLYKPPEDGIRQIIALSRQDAERLPRLPSVAFISITAPGRPPARLNGFAHILRLSFDDVDFLNPELSMKARKRLVHVFDAEHAQAIWTFVDSLPAGVSSVVVHCEGGYSRSCAVALAIHRRYGYHTEAKYLSLANPSVFQLMIEN